MAETDFGALGTARKKLWSDNIWSFAMDKVFWHRSGMVGQGISDLNSIVHKVDELTKTTSGDKCVMMLVPELQSDGTAGDDTLIGNEESMGEDDVTITLDMLRHAVRSKGKMSEQRTVLRFRANAKQRLGIWLAQKIDELCFLTVSGVAYSKRLDGTTRPAGSAFNRLAFGSDVTAPSANRKFYAGTGTALNQLTAGDTLSWNRIVEVKAEAARRKIRPISEGGREYYVLLTHTYGGRDLGKDPTYQTACAQAEQRGSGNPLFTGARKIVDGTVIYEHNKVINSLGLPSGSLGGASGTVHWCQTLVLGAQAMAFAPIGDVAYDEDPLMDYSNKPGISTGRMFGLLKPTFTRPEEGTEEDFGVLSLYHAAAPID